MKEYEKKHRIGIDMGGMSIKIGMVDEKNTIFAVKKIPTRLKYTPETVIRDMAINVKQLWKENGVSETNCKGIGIGSPGTIDERQGEILYSNNFQWENVKILSELQNYFDTKMAVANDADVAALGEQVAGAGRGCKNLVLLTLGTGVGSGVIINGKIFHGSVKGGCELGHMVIAADGEMCTCGRKGCFEAYASATALMRMGREEARREPESLLCTLVNQKLEQIDGKIIFEAEKAGDLVAKRVVDAYETYLAIGIANIINAFRPQCILLGGGVAAQKEYLTDAVQEKVSKFCFGGKHGEIAKIKTSILGNDAGIIGAANLVE